MDIERRGAPIRVERTRAFVEETMKTGFEDLEDHFAGLTPPKKWEKPTCAVVALEKKDGYVRHRRVRRGGNVASKGAGIKRSV